MELEIQGISKGRDRSCPVPRYRFRSGCASTAKTGRDNGSRLEQLHPTADP